MARVSEPYDGAALRRRREAVGWSAGMLARKANMSEKQVQNIEKGITRSPLARTRQWIERALREAEAQCRT